MPGDANFDGKTFEELCRSHVRAFARSAEQFASETKLSLRVGEWQSRLIPKLQEEDERPNFDIHTYSEKVLSRVRAEARRKEKGGEGEGDGGCDDNDDDALIHPNAGKASMELDVGGPAGGRGTRVEFRAVVPDEADSYEVCRLFLSSLMLCNSGNILLQHKDNEDRSPSTGETAAVAGPDTFEVELLDDRLNSPMQTFLAPSAMDEEEEITNEDAAGTG